MLSCRTNPPPRYAPAVLTGLSAAIVLVVVMVPTTVAMPSFSPTYGVACTGPGASVNILSPGGTYSESGLAASATAGTFTFSSQIAGPLSGPGNGHLTSQEFFSVDPSPSGCYNPSTSFATATATFTFSFSGRMNQSVICPGAGADLSLTLHANVYSSTSGALFASPPSTTPVSSTINCAGGPTSFVSTVGGASITTGSFAVVKGTQYGFYAEVDIYNNAGVTLAGGASSSSESAFQVTLASVSCPACP